VWIDLGVFPQPGDSVESFIDHETYLRLYAEKHGKIEEQKEELTESENIGISIIGGKIRLLSLSQDGQYRFIDSTDKKHNILYVATRETLALKKSIEELESFMNDSKVNEQAYQIFLKKTRD